MPALEAEEFDDIEIIGLDENRTHNPDKTKSLYNIYLNLSSHPTYEWSRIFSAERQFPRHTMWRRAHIEGSHIVIHAALDEMEKYHLIDLKEDVKNTNAKYRQYLMTQAEANAREEQAKDWERTEIKNLGEKLKFD